MAEPAPCPEIAVRPAGPGDVGAIRLLLEQLGYPATEEAVAGRLALLAGRGTDPVFVGLLEGRICGVLALHWTPMLHLAQGMARITALMVQAEAQDAGLGRALIEAAADAARAAGCGQIELTTGLQRVAAQGFYRRLGFEASSLRMFRRLGPDV